MIGSFFLRKNVSVPEKICAASGRKFTRNVTLSPSDRTIGIVGPVITNSDRELLALTILTLRGPLLESVTNRGAALLLTTAVPKSSADGVTVTSA
jgi:hypothetical protein